MTVQAIRSYSNILQGTKIYGKSVLRFVPLIGWAWFFTESIFLKRQWDFDRATIARDLSFLTEYPPGYFITVRELNLNN